MRRPDTADVGSATIWVLSCCVLLLVVTSVAVLRTGAVLLRHRAEAAADLAALAAAARIGVGDDSCPVAAQIAAANAAHLVSCRLELDADRRSGTARVVVDVAARLPVVGPRSVKASARAGRCHPAGVRSRQPVAC